MRHSSNYVIAKQDAVAAASFCSGSGSTKNVPEKFEATDLGLLTAMDKIVSINPPLAIPEVKTHFGAMDAEFGTVIKEKTIPGQGSIVQWLQTKANSDRVVSGTIGTIPNSEDWHMEAPDISPTFKADMYGILTKSLAFSLDGLGGKVLQSREVISTQLDYGTDADDLNMSTKGQATTAPVLASQVTITMDPDDGGANITHSGLSIPGFTHSITPELLEEHVIGSDFVTEPVLLNRTHVVGFNSNNEASNTWFTELLTRTLSTSETHSIIITYGSVVKFTYTAMTPSKVVEHNIPGRGKIVNDYGFLPTASTTCTVATP